MSTWAIVRSVWIRWVVIGMAGAAMLGGPTLADGATAAGAVAGSVPDAGYLSEQWNLARIGTPSAWARSTGLGITVGIVDTGIDLTHQDLAARVAASTNCIGADDDPRNCHGSGQDDEGHGTFVSGIVAADTSNGVGVAGVAPGARLVVAKALASNGTGALSDINAGIKWAVNHGARIVNLSVEAEVGGLSAGPGQTLAEGVDYAYRNGAIAVVAAGNLTPSLFGADDLTGVNAVVVGATGRDDEVAPYSSALRGARWGLVAPGGDALGPDGKPSCAGDRSVGCVLSTGWFAGRANQYAEEEGTSVAAPHVAGVLALVMGQGVGLSRDDAVTRLLQTAARIPCGPSCVGRVDAAAAVGVVGGAEPVLGRMPADRGATSTESGAAAVPKAAPAAVARRSGHLVARSSTSGPPSVSPAMGNLAPISALAASRKGAGSRSVRAALALGLSAVVLLVAGAGARPSQRRRRTVTTLP